MKRNNDSKKIKSKSVHISNEFEDMTELPENYQVRFQLAKLREVEENANRLALDNVKKNLEITKSTKNLCYIKVAQDTCNAALEQMAEIIKGAAERICADVNATPEQGRLIESFFDELLDELSRVELNIPTTSETDMTLEHAGRASRESARGC